MAGLVGWRFPDRGVLFVVTGPSGVGKSTLIRRAMATIPGLGFSVSATTRPPRPGEVEGVDYHFLSPDRFQALVREQAFLEHATVYDRSYGTLRGPIEQALAEGRSILLDIDVKGAEQVRQRMPDATYIFVLPPDVATLERRLRGRATDGEDVIARRMGQVGEQLRGCPSFDYVVVNDVLDTASAAFTGILLAEMSRTARRQHVVGGILRELDAADGDGDPQLHRGS